MRRFGSWLALGGLAFSATIAIRLVLTLFFSLLGLIMEYKYFGLWIYNTGGGLIAIVGMAYGLSYAADFCIKVSQNIRHSKNGWRYKVVGVYLCVVGALALYSVLFVTERDSMTLQTAVYDISAIVMGGMMMYKGKRTVEIDGPPLTEKERLQKRLEEIESRDNR